MGAMQCYGVTETCSPTALVQALHLYQIKAPLSKTVYLKIMVILEAKALYCALKVFAFNFSMPIRCFEQKKILQIIN